jgi:hypothetical protein
MSKFIETCVEFLAEDRAKKIEWEKKMVEAELKSNLEKVELSEALKKNCKNGDKAYREWFFNYIENGGKPTHSYSCSVDNVFMAKRDFVVPAAYGAYSVSIVFPPKVPFILSKDKNVGHNNIYYYEDGIAKTGSYYVPLYAKEFGLHGIEL